MQNIMDRLRSGAGKRLPHSFLCSVGGRGEFGAGNVEWRGLDDISKELGKSDLF